MGAEGKTRGKWGSRGANALVEFVLALFPIVYKALRDHKCGVQKMLNIAENPDIILFSCLISTLEIIMHSISAVTLWNVLFWLVLQSYSSSVISRES